MWLLKLSTQLRSWLPFTGGSRDGKVQITDDTKPVSKEGAENDSVLCTTSQRTHNPKDVSPPALQFHLVYSCNHDFNSSDYTASNGRTIRE
jgi:hypothetical protein